MLSAWSWGLWVRCDRLAQVNWNNGHYSFCPLRHQAHSTGTGTWGLGWGGAPLILLLRWQGELGQGHWLLIYNPVLLAKKDRGSLLTQISSWGLAIFKKAGWASFYNAGSFFRYHCAALHRSLNENQTPEHVPLARLILSLAHWLQPHWLHSPQTLIEFPPYHTCFVLSAHYCEALSSFS